MQRKREGWILLAVLAALSFLLVRPLWRPPAPVPQGPEVFDPLVFSWETLTAALEFLAREPGKIPEIQALAGEQSHPPLLYLCALLQLGGGQVEAAEALFHRIPPGTIPGVFRYAPYRIHLERNPGQPNPHAAALLSAARAGELPALIAARVFLIESQFPQALEAYLASDPAEWRRYDLDLLLRLRLLDGMEADTLRILHAARASGRLSPDVVQALEKHLQDPEPLRAAEEALFLERVAASPNLRALVQENVQAQLRDQQNFLQRRYRDLLQTHRSSNANLLSDRRVLLLFLSAAQLRDPPSIERWSRELLRRHPAPALLQWINTLSQPAASPSAP